MQDPRKRMREQCETKGLHWAKSVLPTFPLHNENLPYILEWINERESEMAAELETKQLKLSARSTEAAETSAVAALESAKTSGTSSRAALFSAFVSAIALIVAIAALVKQL